MVGNQHQRWRAEPRIQTARGIRDDQVLNAQLRKKSDRQRHGGGTMSLIQMKPPILDDYGGPFKLAQNQFASVPSDGGLGKARDLGVRNPFRFQERVCQPFEAGAEDNGDLWCDQLEI